ncbi:hypothetical protein GWI33_018575 [Rhynchophorus ferrugineus]|uniref:Uncharacterized protein n=1 Tax=Rhynchophorus ferrugineus TaxID=354439 RepID=A0A834HXM2_RHYFE|nr:hypothetical protein GWI33_018575 [Rhynchophorus ferrugineus]
MNYRVRVLIQARLSNSSLAGEFKDEIATPPRLPAKRPNENISSSPISVHSQWAHVAKTIAIITKIVMARFYFVIERNFFR